MGENDGNIYVKMIVKIYNIKGLDKQVSSTSEPLWTCNLLDLFRLEGPAQAGHPLEGVESVMQAVLSWPADQAIYDVCWMKFCSFGK